MKTILIGLSCLCCCMSAFAQTAAGSPAKPQLPKSVYFGDLHLHTAYSLDAAALLTMNRPGDVYRFARGEKIKHTVLGHVQLENPLDFVAVTDRAELFGLMSAIFDKRNRHFHSAIAREFRKGSARLRKGIDNHLYTGELVSSEQLDDADFIAGVAAVWAEIVAAADAADAHEDFTAFVGYQWSFAQKVPNGFASLHRSVIFEDQAPLLPWDARRFSRPEALWAQMEAFRARGGGDVIAIPLGANQSGGLLYAPHSSDGQPIDQNWARQRLVNEPLGEIMQTKGASETHTAFGGNDADADFELLEPGALLVGGPSGNHDDANAGYLREGLKRGLAHEDRLGVNPFKQGFVGNSGTHNGTAGRTVESSYQGHHAIRDNTVPERLTDNPHYNPGALTAVWATANSRTAIFEALRRRETYATSGTRLRVRFFAGWDLDPKAHRRPDMVHYCYSQGVTMGADLPEPPHDGRQPVFVLWAYCDTDSAPLDRLQIVKGWLDQGEVKEQVFADVVVAGKGGACELSGTWTDPQFDKNQRAFYYVRVLETPVKRWSYYDDQQSPLSTDKPEEIQERAWTSPIWYTPAQR